MCVCVCVCVCVLSALALAVRSRMDVEEAACVWLLNRRRKKQRERHYWIHPILHDRLTHGMFTTLYPSLRNLEKKFLNYLRMSIKSFDDLLEIIKEDITSSNTEMRDSICPEEKLVITLR